MKVYIAGPLNSSGNVAVNIRNVLAAAEALVAKGHLPFVPHLNHFWHLVQPHPDEFWMAWDLAWLEVCDAILRLPGQSYNADTEVDHARRHNIPVFQRIEDILDRSGR